MCGIAGIFNLSRPSPIDRDLLQAMNDTIAHRGPDGEGIHLEPGVGLAHRRLAFIDLAGGQQPIFNETGTVCVTFNGEIYNYRALTAELRQRGHQFRTRSDTEVIVHAWEEWGTDCLARLEGMFAFALHDRSQRALLLARDRLGKKPIYYTFSGNSCLFASELKALLVVPEVERKLDLRAVDAYFAYGYVPDPATIYEGIHKLPAAHYLLLRADHPVAPPQEYWRLSLGANSISEAEACEELRERLSRAVEKRLMSEVPLGAFLSGGVDSSAVVALMSRHSADAIKTFAMGFGSHGVNELPFAQAVADRYGTDHLTAEITPDFVGDVQRQAAIFDEPFADRSAVPTLQICRLARRRVHVALSGDGGDEIFAGYRRYAAHTRAEIVRASAPQWLRGPVLGGLGAAYPKLDWAPSWLRAKFTFKELALDSVAGYYRMVCKVQDEMRARLFTDRLRRGIEGSHPIDIVAGPMQEADTGDALRRVQYADIKTYLAGDILTKVDRASMATSLEVRAPMLDHAFVEWAVALPAELKLRRREGKYLLKRALEPLIPHDCLYRRKQGFDAPLARQFRGPAAQRIRDILLGDAMLDSGIFERQTIAAIVEQHRSGRTNHEQVIWSLLMFAGFLSEVHAGNRPTRRRDMQPELVAAPSA